MKQFNQPEIVDNRERCPICNRLAPSHKRWCITPVLRGERTQETQEIEGTQSPCCDNAGLGVKELPSHLYSYQKYDQILLMLSLVNREQIFFASFCVTLS